MWESIGGLVLENSDALVFELRLMISGPQMAMGPHEHRCNMDNICASQLSSTKTYLGASDAVSSDPPDFL